MERSKNYVFTAEDNIAGAELLAITRNLAKEANKFNKRKNNFQRIKVVATKSHNVYIYEKT